MLKDQLLIEFARVSDANEIGFISKSEIEHGLGWRYTPKRIENLISDKNTNVVVARNDSRLAGFGIMTYYDDQANLDLLAVKKIYRRQKIGGNIVTWLEKVATNSGAFNVFVQVRKSNIGAITFYQNIGFGILETQEGYYSRWEAGVIMSKSLRQMFNIT